MSLPLSLGTGPRNGVPVSEPCFLSLLPGSACDRSSATFCPIYTAEPLTPGARAHALGRLGYCVTRMKSYLTWVSFSDVLSLTETPVLEKSQLILGEGDTEPSVQREFPGVFTLDQERDPRDARVTAAHRRPYFLGESRRGAQSPAQTLGLVADSTCERPEDSLPR